MLKNTIQQDKAWCIPCLSYSKTFRVGLWFIRKNPDTANAVSNLPVVIGQSSDRLRQLIKTIYAILIS